MFKNHNYYVYIITNKNNSVLYTGVTNTLERRVYEHKNKTDPKSFTAKYNINKLVYFEYFNSIEEAIIFEKKIKAGSRKKKILLVEKNNKSWRDLAEDWD